MALCKYLYDANMSDILTQIEYEWIFQSKITIIASMNEYTVTR